MEKLPNRLKGVASLIPCGKTVADIGTDHALIPIYLVQSGIALKVIASDINKAPFRRARTIVRLHGLEDLIDMRMGDGLKILKPGEAETIVISGLGGLTIIDILNASPEVLEKAETLVLSPATHESEVRHWLKDKGWQLADEELVEDHDRIYQILQATPEGKRQDENWTELEYEVGPVILRKRHLLLKEYLSRKLKKYEKAVNNLRYSQSLQSAEKRKKILGLMEDIRKYMDLL